MRGVLVVALGFILFGASRAQAQARGSRVMPAAPRAGAFTASGRPIARFTGSTASALRMPAPAARFSSSTLRRSPVFSHTILRNGGSVTVIGGSGGFGLGGPGFGGLSFNSGLPLAQSTFASAQPGIDFNQLSFDERQQGIQAIIDPITQHEIGLFEHLLQVGAFTPISFVPIWGGYGGYDGGATVVQSPPPQVIVIEPPATQPAPAAAAAPQAAPEAAAPPETPLPPLGQFSLVRRDGTVINSVAFSVHGNQIIYITAEGSRHAIATDQIDLKATEERNAESGTILHLSQ